MKTVHLESSSEEDDLYLNSVAKLKALKKKQILLNDRQKDEEAEEKTKELKVTVSEENIKQRKNHRTRSKRKNNTQSSKQKQIEITPDQDLDLEIISVVEKPNSLGNDLLIIEDSVSEDTHSSEDENYDLTIKILWRSKDMHRLNIRKNENFRKVFEYFAEIEKVSIDEILITKKDKTIKKKDTPASINLSVIDILEGGIIKKDSTVLQNKVEQDSDEETCVIKVQTTNKKNIMVSVKRDENFKVLLTKCTQELNVDESKIKLYFDGELVTSTDTPDSLEIDDEACFDLKLCS